MEGEWEYIVVGSGAGGGPVAANLAEAGYRVLLLEAGGADETYNYKVPAFHPNASEEPDMSWQFFVRHYANDQQQRRDSKYVEKERGIFYPRAGTLGGCTAHNAMILTYPANEDWNRIGEVTGDGSWNADSLRKYYQRLENCGYRPLQHILYTIFRINPSRHGFRGWLNNHEADPLIILGDDELLDLIVESVKKSFITVGITWRDFFHQLWDKLITAFKTALDPNDWYSVERNAVGTRLTPLTTNKGHRTSPRERILAVQKKYPDKLTIQLGALVTRVLFDDDNRATGVEFLSGNHLYKASALHQPGQPQETHQALATREVILAGGAFNTPQLLQLSGIGPAALLKKHGIPVRVDLPGVGENLQDRYEVTVVLKMKKPFKLLEGATLRPPEPGEEPDPQFKEWLKGKGVYTTNGAVVSVIMKSAETRPLPDIFLFGLVSNFYGYFPGYSKIIQKSHQSFTWAILKAHTNNNAGRVAIKSADPTDTPDIDFHYFKEGNDTTGEDLDSVIDAVEFVRRMTAGYGDLIDGEEKPGPAVKSREQISQYVQDQAWGHHASCTCKIGADNDPMAVLDSRFRVRGTKGLRVVDASIFPYIPGFFIVAAIYIAAEKASDEIIKDAQAQAQAQAKKG